LNRVSNSKPKSVVFLFINGPHHVYHLIIPALKFSSISGNLDVIFVSGNPKNTQIIGKTAASLSINNFRLIDIPIPLRYRIQNYKGKLYPPVYTRIEKVTNILLNATAIISTSHELPQHLDKHKIRKPILFYLYHGTGTREYGFESKLGQYDYIFTPGPYHQNRLTKSMPSKRDNFILAGAPKLEWMEKELSKEKKLFENQNPVIYYNPHWDTSLSSYLKWGDDILDYFLKNNNVNLIFSPHPLLKHFAKSKNYKVSKDGRIKDNIIIDMSSERCFNGSYIMHSDIYLGDVSSLATEWMIFKSRPCIFINAHKIEWKNNESYQIWKYGKVIDNVKDLNLSIQKASSIKNNHLHQNNFKKAFIHDGEKPGSDICAEFIKDIIDNL